MDRRTFVSALSASGVSATLANAIWNQAHATPLMAATAPAKLGEPLAEAAATQSPPRVTAEMLRAAESVIGVRHTPAQRAMMLERIESDLNSYAQLRALALPNDLAPPFVFNPLLPGRTATSTRRSAGAPAHSRRMVTKPEASTDIAFLPVLDLAELIRTQRLTSTELTSIYLERLQRHNATLRCVVNLTPELALKQAAAADAEIAAGRYRGPLHGIPYGVKDSISVPGYPTTWGSRVYRDRILPTTATVVERLEQAGAVLVAKLALGELGLSDRWYGGQTMGPWNPEVGALGSSSGSAAAVSAGLVGFAIGTETMGSIITPAARNGVTALRPTFGRVSRHGVMTLCWTLDKVGPVARDVEGCAVILEAIAGQDAKDPSVAALDWEWEPDRPPDELRVGYFEWAFEQDHAAKAQTDAALASLRRLGVRPIPVEMPSDLPVNAALLVRVEAAAAFDDIDKVRGLDALAVQDKTGWPNFIRSSRFVPAADYLQAQRVRTLLMQRMDEVFNEVDVFMTPTFGVISLTNLTGHPAVVVPSGFTPDGLPTSISFIGRPFGESDLCTVARAWQIATGFQLSRPAAYQH